MHLCSRLTLAAVISFATLLAAAPCRATFTGLVQIPIAYQLAPGTYDLTLSIGGNQLNFGSQVSFLETQFGLSSRVEAGIDVPIGGPTLTGALLNIKYLVSTERGHRPALAAGIAFVGSNTTTAPYAVATKRLGAFRGDLGVVMSDLGGMLFAGVDHPLRGGFDIMADYISGPGNSTGIGIAYVPSGPFSVLVGVLFPNSSIDSTELQLLVSYSGTFRLPWKTARK
jgi:hypothetical protein